MSGSPNPPWEGSRLLVDRRPTKQVLPSTSAGRRLCLATHLGPLMPAGHSQPPWQGTQLLLVPVGWIFHSVTQLGAVPKVVDSRWPGGYLSGRSCLPHPSSLPTPGAERESKADRTCLWGDGEGISLPGLPTQVEVKVAHWPPGPPWPKTKMLQRPPFSAPLEG